MALSVNNDEELREFVRRELRNSDLATLVRQMQGLAGGRPFRAGLATVTWAGANPGASLTGVAHGLGLTPLFVGCFDTGGSNWIAAPESGVLTATTFDIFIRTADGGAGGAGNTQRIGWVAIG